MIIKSNDVRNIFLKYFKDNNHTIVNSSSLISNDSDLLFTNAGMNQFKEYFLGIKKNLNKNFTSIQRCLRVSGKHNDFKNVGYTSRHNTFFEMMGNFSFGSYFKKEAIIYAWNLLINKNLFNLNKDNIIVTVHKNDIESYNIWLNIIKLNKKSIFLVGNSTINSSNFWRMGDLGLCGYSTEIFYNIYNRNNKYYSFVNNKNKFLEIWNLVFLEFNLDINNKLNILSNKCIDTGMGLERIVSILQGVKSNFDIDIFIDIKYIISNILCININDNNINNFNVISDHIRAIIYLIIDGIYPSNTHRGYILRKIIRRALVHIKFLNINDIILYKIINNILNNIYDFKNLNINIKNNINDIILKEENRFFKTIYHSIKLLNYYIIKLCKKKKYYLSSKIVFLLYDTYGLPIDILIDICKYYNISINLDKFNLILSLRKKFYKIYNKRKSINEKYFINLNILNTLNSTKFVGYNNRKILSKVLFIFNKNSIIKETRLGLNCSIVLNYTVLYPKCSGQSGDTGFLIKLNNSSKFIIYKTRKIGNYIIHYGCIKYGFLKVNDIIKCYYDIEHRNSISRNHSCLHILCSVLKNILGKNILFNGSNITKNYFTLDFCYKNNIDNYILLKIENMVNNYILECINIKQKYIKNKLLFKNKFNFFGKNIVRLIILRNVSKEYCSGTHILNTKDIGIFLIVKIYNISSGIKRIKAITYINALLYIYNNKYILHKICNIFNIDIYNLYNHIKKFINKNKKNNDLNKKITNLFIKNIINIFNNKDILFYKNYKILFKKNLNFDFLNKNILFIILNNLYFKYDLSIIFIYTLINKKFYFIYLIKSNIIYIFKNFFKKIKLYLSNKNILFKNYFKIKNKNFSINVFYIDYNIINKRLVYNYILNYIKKKF